MILALAIGKPNPFSFGGARNEAFDPVRPGIICLSRNPLLLALALWAAAHLVPNGDLAHVLLFGTFALFALFGGRLVDRRRQREMGPEWQHLRETLEQVPMLGPPASCAGSLARAAMGLILYAAMIALHPWLFGVNPLP